MNCTCANKSSMVEDAFRRIALEARFLVHVWSAVENGDDHDSYFWKRIGASAGECESDGTFAVESDAWQDCCEKNGLLAPYAQALQDGRYQICRTPGFLSCYWVAADGSKSALSFASPAQALIACFIEQGLVLGEEHAELRTEEIEPSERRSA